MDRYNKERVTLETKEGTALDLRQLREVWERRIKEFFPHYKLIKIEFEEEQGLTKF